MLLDIQDEYNYLPKEALTMVAETLDIPLINIYAVATFYKVFSLQPRGEYLINVCLGTACHVRGGKRIVEEIERILDINVGETTPDMRFTLETVRCLGACALGPVIVINDEYHGHMDAKKTVKLLKQYTGS
jgi:NADH-quinone oxidoreductase subunit E